MIVTPQAAAEAHTPASTTIVSGQSLIVATSLRAPVATHTLGSALLCRGGMLTSAELGAESADTENL
jgi:hypothetical protein